MAVLKNGINGGFSGKVGDVVGYNLNGQQVIRAKPKRTIPPTEKELLNRTKFVTSQKWLDPLCDFFRISFKGYQPTFQGATAAMSYNHKNALQKNEEGDFFINPALALVSFGNQELPSTANAVNTENQEIVLTWSKDGTYRYNDQAMVVAYDIKNGKVIYNAGISKRQTCTAILKLPETAMGNTYHVYLAFIADDRSSKSNSMYLGNLLIK